MTQVQYEQLLSFWRLIDGNMISGEDMEPLRHVYAGELLYLDGNRREALNAQGGSEAAGRSAGGI